MGSVAGCCVMGRSNMSRVGMAASSSIGRSTVTMKSVPSPGSPSQTLSPVSSLNSSLSTWLRITIFSWSWFSISSFTCESSAACAASGMMSVCSAGASCSLNSRAVSVACGSCAFAAFAASSAAIASNSFLDLRPRFLGAGFSTSSFTSAFALSAAACSAASCSANSESSEGFLTFLVAFVSRFSASVPLTV